MLKIKHGVSSFQPLLVLCFSFPFKRGETALHLAAKHDNLECVDVLLRANANILAPNLV